MALEAAGHRSATRRFRLRIAQFHGPTVQRPLVRDPKIRTMPSITDRDVRAFLESGTRTGKLSYTSTSGRPLVAPIWFVLDGDQVVFNTGKDTAKGRALRRDPTAALCVDLEQPPYAFVQVQATATLSEDPDELLRTATNIAQRYMGSSRAQEFGRRNAVPGELLVRLRPTKIVAEFDMTG